MLGWSEECGELYAEREEQAKYIRTTLSTVRPPTCSELRRVCKLDETYRAIEAKFQAVKVKAKAEAERVALANMSDKAEWARLRAIRNRKKLNSPLSPPFLGPEGESVSNIEDKLTLLAKTLFPTARQQEPRATPTPQQPPTTGTTGLEQVSKTKLKDAVFSLEKDKAVGLDGIGVNLMQTLYSGCEEFNQLLTDLVNNCLQSGNFPTEWKRAKITVMQQRSPATEFLPPDIVTVHGRQTR